MCVLWTDNAHLNNISMEDISRFDDFEWLLANEEVKENILPDENVLVYRGHSTISIGFTELYFVELFYDRYVRVLGPSFIQKKIDALDNEVARAWANYAMNRMPTVIKYENDEFANSLEDLLYRLDLPYTNLIEVFKPYMPFFTNEDYFKFAYDKVDSPLYRYFWILFILFYEDEYPKDETNHYPQSYRTCEKKETCKEKERCKFCRRCWYFEACYGKDYDFAKEMLDFQKEMTLSFLSIAPKDKKDVLLVKLYESFQQINQSGLFEAKLSLSYDKVLYGEGKPMTGGFFLRWDKVNFFDGFYIIKHPDVPFNKARSFRIEDPNSRKAFNDISSLFMKKLPPLRVQAKNGHIVKVLNKANLSQCISLMEHKVAAPNVLRKKAIDQAKVEKKEISKAEAKSRCKELKSRYLDYLCAKQLDEYKVICCIEHRVNSSGAVSCEYSFIFTIKETRSEIFLAYENSSESRCTYLLSVSRHSWRESIEKIYDFFASNEVNKRQLMASNLVDLHLPGNYEYQRLFHSDYLAWVDKVKHFL